MHRMQSLNQLIVPFCVLWTMCWQIDTVKLVRIDCDCSNASLEIDLQACCMASIPEIDDTTELSFYNVASNGSTSTSVANNILNIVLLKICTTHNHSNIPTALINAFAGLSGLDLSIGLQRIPTDRLPGKLKQLNLGRNRIKCIERDAFGTAAGELEHINLQHNQIDTITANGAFNGLNKLNTLILYRNRLTALRSGVFAGAESLEYLDVASNEIDTIDDDALTLAQLKEILISDNRLHRLSDNLFRLAPNVHNVDMQKNRLERIGKAFTMTRHLQQLLLSENQHLEDIDVVALSTLPELISLSIDATGMRTLYDTNASVSTPSTSPLHTLSVSQNHFSDANFLRQLAIFPRLQNLFVDANKFTRWHDGDVRNIKNLFPHIELIVTKNNAWDRQWVDNTLIPVFQANNIFCSNVKYLNTYIEGFTNSVDGQIIESIECI